MGSNPIIPFCNIEMYLTIVSLPFCGSVAAGLFGKYLGFQGSGIVSTTCCGFSSLFSVVGFYEVILSSCKCTFVVGP